MINTSLLKLLILLILGKLIFYQDVIIYHLEIPNLFVNKSFIKRFQAIYKTFLFYLYYFTISNQKFKINEIFFVILWLYNLNVILCFTIQSINKI